MMIRYTLRRVLAATFAVALMLMTTNAVTPARFPITCMTMRTTPSATGAT